MQPSFWGTNPFLTGKRQKKSQNAEITLWLRRWEILLLALLLKCFMVQPSFVVSSYQDRSRKKLTYLSILSFLSLGLFLCKLLLSLLSFGCLLPPDFVILIAGKPCYSQMCTANSRALKHVTSSIILPKNMVNKYYSRPSTP